MLVLKLAGVYICVEGAFNNSLNFPFTGLLKLKIKIKSANLNSGYIDKIFTFQEVQQICVLMLKEQGNTFIV